MSKITTGAYDWSESSDATFPNFGDYNYDEYKNPPVDPKVGIYYTTVLVSVLGMLLNLFTITSICCMTSKLNLHLKLLLSLAVSDLFLAMYLCLYGMIHVIDYNYIDVTPEVLAALIKTSQSLNYAASFSALLNLAGLAIDHYLAIIYPFLHKRLQSKWMGNTVVVTIWLITAAFAVLLLSLPEIVDFTDVVMIEAVSRLTATLLCLILMVFCYVSINTALLRRQNVFASDAHGLKAMKKCLITSLLLLATFLVGWIPHILMDDLFMLLYLTGAKKEFFQHPVRPCMYIVFAVNTICDPIIYTIRVEKIRATSKKMLKRITRFCRDRSDSGTPASRSMSVWSTKSTIDGNRNTGTSGL